MRSWKADIKIFQTAALQGATLNWYVIADSAQHRDLPNALVQVGSHVRCLFGSSQDSPVAKHAPHLVALGPPLESDSAWRWICLNAKSRPCLSVIATQIAFDALFAQLAECTQVVLPDGDAMFFAFWDPAILGTLVGQADDLTLHVKGPVLSSGQRSMLMQGFAGWWYWDRAGERHAIAMEQSGNVKSAGPITLNQRQVDDLVEASVPDHVLYYVELNQPLLLADIPSTQRYAVVRHALVSARDIGLLAMGDLVNFVCLALIYKDRIRNDSRIVDVLRRVKQGQLTFHAALEALP